MEIAKVQVSGVRATSVWEKDIPAGITGAYVTLEYTDPMWDSLIKNVTFRGAEDKSILNVGNSVYIPPEVVAEPNVGISIGLCGVREDGTAEIPTLWADLGTVKSAAPTTADLEAEAPNEAPTPSMWAQVLAMIGKLDTLATDEKSSLVAAINWMVEKGIGTPEIGENGNWWIGKTDTGVPVHVSPCTPEEFEKIKQDIADLKYVPIQIMAISNNVGTVELGTEVDTVTVSWSLNKEPADQSLEGESLEVSARSAVLTPSGDYTFELTATDERGATASASTKVNFLNGVYYGALEYGAAVDSAAILGLSKKLQSGKAVTFTATGGEGKRPAYACPARYGTPTFKIGGFEYEWEKVAAFDFTNASGYTEPYDVWMHGQDVSGSITVSVT